MSALPAVGEGIYTAVQLDLMPPGTIIEVPPGDEFYTKQDDGRWQARSGRHAHGSEDFTMGGHNRVRSYPDGFVIPVPPPETLAQWQWRWRDVTLHQAAVHGVSRDLVVTTMRGLGVPDFPIGTGMRVTNAYDLDRLPAGTVVYLGDPGRFEQYGVFVHNGRGWLHLLGEWASFNGSQVTVDTIAGETVHQDWIEAVGTDEDRRAIRAFKAKAWPVVYKIKRDHGWCSAFENIMAMADLDDTYVNVGEVDGVLVGDKVTLSRASTLPVGTILRWHDDTGSEFWFVRDDGSTNVARTSRLFGWFDNGGSVASVHQASDMEVAWFPAETMMVPLAPDDMTRLWDHLPPGIHFTTPGNGYDWVMCHDHRATEFQTYHRGVPATGEYQRTDFNGSRRFHLTAIPRETT